MKIYAVTPQDSTQPHSLPAVRTIVDSALMPWRKPFFLPTFDPEFHLRLVPAVVLSRLGKSISLRFAERYYTEGAMGFLTRAEELYHRLLNLRMPTAQAESFDCSVMISPRVPFAELAALWEGGIEIRVNDRTVAERRCHNLVQAADEAIHYLSQTSTLKTGDIIFLDVPEEGIKVAEADRIQFFEAETGRLIHQFTIK